jgi:ribonucleoside-diphosphate reductase alpha chain
MSVQELQNYTYYAKYARYNWDLKRRETWSEAVQRMRDMHVRKYPQAESEINYAFEFVKNQRVLGSQRALQFGGKPIESKNGRIFNCTSSYCDRLRFFQEALWWLLAGSGVGFSVQKHHVAKLPDFSTTDRSGLKTQVYLIPDSIEGWSDALGVLLSSYFNDPVFPEYANCIVEYDYSAIRPAGSFLSSAGGKAPGPKPLYLALEKIRTLLDRCLSFGMTKLRPIDAYDIVMHSSDAVLSGGVRRSATLCIFSRDDQEMLTAKTGNWFYDNPQRARSNNSVMLIRSETTRDDFKTIIESVKEFGEPGFILSDSTESLFNPCVEANFYSIDTVTGKSGWQGCNLSTMNGKLIRYKQDFIECAIAASIIGTLQAGYTDFPYLGEVTERIFRREALLGVSITGMMDSPDVLFNPEYQNEAASIIAFTNRRIAELININPAARCTLTKPEGTTSCLLGTASGIHPHHSHRYFRRVQANELESCFQLFKKTNPHACEKSVWSANNTDSVITFCVEPPEGAKTKQEIDAITLLKYVKLTQQNWVKNGKEPRLCTQPWLNHNVSNTINVRDHEWEAVTDLIYDNKEDFTAVSILPHSGDKDYPQAPFVAVFTPDETKKMYGENNYQVAQSYCVSANCFASVWEACEAVLGRIATTSVFQESWVSNVLLWAKEVFDGDVKKVTYLLKDVDNWKTWEQLKSQYVSCDYSLLRESEDTTTHVQEVACSGGSCELI